MHSDDTDKAAPVAKPGHYISSFVRLNHTEPEQYPLAYRDHVCQDPPSMRGDGGLMLDEKRPAVEEQPR